MSVNPGTLRGTPSRNQGRGSVPFPNNNSPAPAGASSAIPRPVLETPPAAASEVGGSSLSASRQKQTKRDEVRCLYPSALPTFLEPMILI